MAEHFTKESEGRVGSIVTEDDARKAHHLASADPELDGLMTGPAHEQKYGLEREPDSAGLWRAAGVHPYKNGALAPGDDGGENVRGRVAPETAEARKAPETAEASRAKK